MESQPTGTSCPACGAPIDVTKSVSNSGWVKQPPIADMAKIQFAHSSAQIAGSYVPVTEVNLAKDEWVYFAHHVLLHVDPGVKLANMPGGFSRMFAGLPISMCTAAGPGRIAFSFDHPGETIAVPLQAGQTIEVTEHRLLAATGSVTYTYNNTGVFIRTEKQTSDGVEYETAYPFGQMIDHFTAKDGPGLLFLHAPGNVFVRDLAEGEAILIQPGALVYADPTVSPYMHLEWTAGGPMGLWPHLTVWARLTGPGRIAMSSVFESEAINGNIVQTSGHTQQVWS